VRICSGTTTYQILSMQLSRLPQHPALAGR
jgi:hypothetical protein